MKIATSRQPVSLIPDGCFALATPLGKAHFFVEVDRGTETLDRFKQKVQAYIVYHENGGYEKRYGTKSLRILTVATGEGRLSNLLAATVQVTKEMGSRRRFWFALASTLTPQSVLTQPIAGEQEARALITPTD